MGLQIISEREGFILDPYAVIGIRVFADLVKMVEENFQNKKKTPLLHICEARGFINVLVLFAHFEQVFDQ